MAETANVDVLVNAFTEAAEQSLDEVGDALTGLAADGVISEQVLDELGDELDDATLSALGFQTAADEAGDEASGLARAMGRLARNADDAGDELVETGFLAGGVTGAFAALSLSTDGLNFSLGSMSSTIILVAIPALLALLTILAPLTAALAVMVGALGGLALGFGAVIGTGFLTHFQDIKRAVLEARDAILPFLRVLGNQFGPLLVEGAEALTPLFFRIMEATDGFDTFADSLRRIGGIIFDVLPGIIGGMMDLGEQALPVLEDFIGFLQSDGEGAMAGMKDAFEQVQPGLMGFIDAIIDASPAILDFGTNLLDRLLPGLEGAVRGGGDLLRNVDWEMVDRVFREAADAATALFDDVDWAQVRVLVMNAAAAFEDAWPSVKLLMERLGELMPVAIQIAQQTLPFLIRAGGQLADVLAAVVDVVNMVIDAIGPEGLMAAVAVAVVAIALLGGPISLLTAAVIAAAAAFPLLKAAIEQLPQYVALALGHFAAAFDVALSGVRNDFVVFWNDLVALALDGVQALLDAVVPALNGFLQVVRDAVNAFERVTGEELADVTMLSSPDLSGLSNTLQAETRRVDGQQRARERTQQVAVSLGLNVEGDGPLADFLNEQLTVEEQARRQRQERFRRRQNIGGSGA